MNDEDLLSLVRHGKWDRVRDEALSRPDAVGDDGCTLLEAAAMIDDPELRNQVLGEVLDLDLDVALASRGSDGVLATFLAGDHDDPESSAALLVRLLEAGADTSHPFGDEGRTPSMELAYTEIPEDALGRVYDLWFARRDLRLRHVSDDGANALTLAESLDRVEFLARAQRWLEDHPEDA